VNATRKKSPNATEEVIAKAVELRRTTKLTLNQIGEQLGGYSGSTVSSWIKTAVEVKTKAIASANVDFVEAFVGLASLLTAEERRKLGARLITE